MDLRERTRLFTIDDYYRMADSGILSERDRVELIEGRIVEMSPPGSRHAACVNKLNALLNDAVRDAAIVAVQNPIRLSEYAEPEPDLALLRPREDFYAEAHPSPADVLLILEVSESSLEYDLNVKVPLYARSGIPEVWVVDLAGGEIHVHRRPVEGDYQEVGRKARGEVVDSRVALDLKVKVDDLLV